MSYYNGQEVVNTIITGGAVDLTPSGKSTNPLANKSISQNFSNVLKGIKSGITVSVDDASPLEHELSVKVESKNIFTNESVHLQTTIDELIRENENTVQFTSVALEKSQSHATFDLYLEKGTYYFSSDNIITSNAAHKGGCAVYKGNTQILYKSAIEKIDCKFTITEDGNYDIYFYGAYGVDTNTVYTYSNIQLERGSSKTDFTPFVYAEDIAVSKLVDGVEVQSETPLADGTVEGFTSSPAFELISSEDDGSVLINLEYNKDINKISFGTGDGFSPIAKVEETTSGATITITDKNGTTTATVTNGKDGDPYTLTEADKAEIVAEVIDSIGTPIFGTIDENNNIILSGELADGTYTLKYENNGEYDEICTYTIGKVDYTNLISTSIDTDGSVYNGIGYKPNTRLNSSGNAVEATGIYCTGFMPCKNGDYVYFANMSLTSATYNYINVYDESKTLLKACAITSISNTYTTEFDDNGNVIKIRLAGDAIANAAYFRISATLIDSTSIITVNQSIGESEAPDTTLTLEAGLKIDSSTGAEATGNTSYSASNYIEIKDGFTYTVYKKSSISEGLKVCYYDAEKNFISTSGDVIVSTTNQTSATIPLINGASFFRLRIYGTASLLDEATWEVTAEVSA